MLGQFYQSVRFIIFQAIPAALGVSAIKQYHVNSLAVPRKAKEAIGGITKLTHKDGTQMSNLHLALHLVVAQGKEQKSSNKCCELRNVGGLIFSQNFNRSRKY